MFLLFILPGHKLLVSNFCALSWQLTFPEEKLLVCKEGKRKRRMKKMKPKIWQAPKRYGKKAAVEEELKEQRIILIKFDQVNSLLKNEYALDT